MFKEKRNDMLNGYLNVINWVINLNWPLISALQLEREDVFQDLCVAAIMALDSFDPDKGCTCRSYLISKLQYAVLDLKRKHKVHGMTGYDYKNPATFVPLNVDFDGYSIDAPSEESYELVELEMFMEGFPREQRTLISERVHGKFHRKKAERASIQNALESIVDGYIRRG